MEISHHSDGVDGLQHLIKYLESLLLRNTHLTHILVEGGLVKLRDQAHDLMIYKFVFKLKKVSWKGWSFAIVE